jgi:cardiolipin synthase
MWNVCRYTEPSYSIYKPEICVGKGSAGIVQPYGTVPLENEAVGENIYIQMINNAKHYIYIFTPYMVVGNELLMAVKLAAKKGVDVRIVTPGVPDKKFIYRMTQSTYKELLQAGVRIFQYAPGFIHSKCVLCDDRVASVGSINMDNRSFYHHFECGILLYEVEQLKKIKGDMMETFEASEEINLPWCREKLKGFGLFDALLRLLSPLL